jgi:hypothetical protein
MLILLPDILTCSYVLTTISYFFRGIDHQATGFNASHTVVTVLANPGLSYTCCHQAASVAYTYANTF